MKRALAVVVLFTLSGCHGKAAPTKAATHPATPAPAKTAPAAAPATAPAAKTTATTPADAGTAATPAAKTADAVPPKPDAHFALPPDAKKLEALVKRLTHHVRVWAFKDPKNVWALCHGILALGPKVRLKDGRLAVDAILAQAKVVTVHGKRIPVFEGNAPDGTPIEPHAHLVIRSLLDSGVSPKHRFRAGGHTFTVKDIYDGMLWSFEPPAPGSWGAQAWTLMAMARGMRDGLSKPTFTNADGKTFHIPELVSAAEKNLAQEMAFFREVRDEHVPLVKRRQGVYHEPCGGFHFLQMPAHFLFDGAPDRAALAKDLLPTLQDLEGLDEFRLAAETDLYARTRKIAPPRFLRLLAIQDLKFSGHWLEATHDLYLGGVRVDPAKVDAAENDLLAAIARLDTFHAFAQMEQVNRQRHQSYLDLIGDSAHALRGLRGWLQVQKAKAPDVVSLK